MMKFPELSQHPEYRELLAYVGRLVDSARDTVVIESQRGDLIDIKYAAGRHAALYDILNSLRGDEHGV